MTGDKGGETGAEKPGLAPVIPLFGGRAPSKGKLRPGTAGERGIPDDPEPSSRDFSGDDAWGTWTYHDTEPSEGTPSDRHPAHGGASKPAEQSRSPRLRALTPHTPESAEGAPLRDEPPVADAFSAEDDSEETRKLLESAEAALVRKLRARSLSVSEARTVLRSHAITGSQVDLIIEEFGRRGYLDDRTLAGHLVASGTERKGMGRVALSRALAQRGIPRDVIDAALEELPNDDAERALDFARTKARALTRLDHDTALRRLVGQLARRGYGGNVAMTAAKTALAEAGGTGTTGGVRFVDSD